MHGDARRETVVQASKTADHPGGKRGDFIPMHAAAPPQLMSGANADILLQTRPSTQAD
jgi:hypothetical protein